MIGSAKITRFDCCKSFSSPDNGSHSLTPLAPQLSQRVKFIKWLINLIDWLFGITQKFSTQLDVNTGGNEVNFWPHRSLNQIKILNNWISYIYWFWFVRILRYCEKTFRLGLKHEQFARHIYEHTLQRTWTRLDIAFNKLTGVQADCQWTQSDRHYQIGIPLNVIVNLYFNQTIQDYFIDNYNLKSTEKFKIYYNKFVFIKLTRIFSSFESNDLNAAVSAEQD